MSALPIGQAQFLLVLDEVTERVAAGPGTADQLVDLLLSAQALDAALMVAGQGAIVPADSSADLNAVAVDASRSVMRRRDAAGPPMLQPAQVAQPSRHGAHARPRLALQLQKIEFRNTGRGPQVRRQRDPRNRVAIQVKCQALHSARAEVPSRDNRFRGHVTKRLGHEQSLPFDFAVWLNW